MKRRFQILILALAAAVALSTEVVAHSFAQAAATSDSPQSGVVLAKLARPVYPPLARATRISGDVRLLLGIRRDKSIESAVIVKRSPALQQTALESVQQSQFECPSCTEVVTSYSLVYTFQLVDYCRTAKNGPSKDAPRDGQPRAQVIQSQNHVTVLDEPSWCDPGVTIHKVRSTKCLYLWKYGWHS